MTDQPMRGATVEETEHDAVYEGVPEDDTIIGQALKWYRINSIYTYS